MKVTQLSNEMTLLRYCDNYSPQRRTPGFPDTLGGSLRADTVAHTWAGSLHPPLASHHRLQVKLTLL
jgi:hypothetical protein